MRAAYAPLELTFKIGRANIVYLDTELTINDTTGRIEYQLHKKPISNKTYIPADSNHPTHILHNIIYNDLLRAHRLCSTEPTRNRHIARISANALKQGYSRKVVDRQVQRAAKKASAPPEPPAEDPPTILTLTYNGRSTMEIVAGLRQHWLTHASRSARLMVAFRCNNNIKQLLVRSKAPSRRKPPTAAKPATAARSQPKNPATLDRWILRPPTA
jgi:hypothetical protein